VAFPDKNKKLVVVYLSKLGCIDYVKVMLRGFKELDPLLVISPANQSSFQDYNCLPFQTYDTKLSLLLHSLTIQSKVNTLLDGLAAKHGDLEVYFPAFHPWNLSFVQWAHKNDSSSVVPIHDFHTHTGETSKITETIQQHCIKKASTVICLSDYVKQQLVAALGYAEKCIVHPIPLLDTIARNKLPHSPKPKLLFLGRALAYKGLDLLISVAKELPIDQLTIAGQNANQWATDDPKIDTIDGYLSDEKVATLLKSHHILALPYKEASQSGILSLGITAQMVMIVSKVGGMPEQLGEDAAFWIEPTKEGLKKAIMTLMDNRERYLKIKEAVVMSS